MAFARFALMLVWLASLGYANIRLNRNSKAKKVFFPYEAHSQDVLALGAKDAVEPNSIFGLVEVSKPQCFDFMARYARATELQLDFLEKHFGPSRSFCF